MTAMNYMPDAIATDGRDACPTCHRDMMLYGTAYFTRDVAGQHQHIDPTTVETRLRRPTPPEPAPRT